MTGDKKITESNTIESEKITESNTIESEKITESNTIESEKITESNTIESEKITESNTIESEKITESNTIESEKIKEYTFLNQDWIHEVTRVVQGARAKDEDFRKVTAGYSLDLLYVIKDLPGKLKVAYHTDGQITLLVKLDKGVVQKLVIGTEAPEGKVDFTVTSSYNTAKDIFNEILNPATAFINRHIKVEPMANVYRRPRFTAQSIIAGNMILKYARQVSTNYDFEK